MRFLVTGGLGFIGSHFCLKALSKGHEVCALDNLSTGHKEFLGSDLENYRFSIVQEDISNFPQLVNVFKNFKPDWIVHFAANADIRNGLDAPDRDLKINTQGTWNVLEAARQVGVKNILFSSTGSVYGEPEIFPTPENAPFPVQTSFYAASKLAGESLISSYCYGYGMTGVVFRFVSILGPHYTHGHVFDFVKQLRTHPEYLDVLGNGEQLKSYLHVNDLMRGLWTILDQKRSPGFDIYNIGHDDALTVKKSISHITQTLGIKPELRFKGGIRGWIGDSPRIQLDCSKLRKLGWTPQHSLESAVQDTTRFLCEHSQFLERRA